MSRDHSSSKEQQQQARENKKVKLRGKDVPYDKKLDGPNRPST